MKKIALISILGLLAAASFFAWLGLKPQIKEYTLVAKTAEWDFGNGTKLPVWTYNGTIPGPEIRVKVGDTVKVKLKNELEEPVTIHWHGINLPNPMDGVPGVTQNAVKPGEEFVYEFKAEKAGTYMYHSHQQSAKQVDKGLSGVIVVEEKGFKKTHDKDFSLMLDEWPADMSVIDSMFAPGSVPAMSQGGGGHHHSMSLWSLFSVNGKMGDAIEPLAVKDGDNVRLRLANIGFFTQRVQINGADYKVINIQGTPVNKPQSVSNKYLEIGPGERYDLEFTANSKKNIYFERFADTNAPSSARVFLSYDGAPAARETNQDYDQLGKIDIANYGAPQAAPFSASSVFDASFAMDLGKNDAGEYTINGKTFIAHTDPIKVDKGQKIKVTFKNLGTDEHPMHLHGHSFQVLTKNGKPIQGSPLVLDTLVVRANEVYEVAFSADNPGIWMFHCHELHHAASGMMQEVIYNGYAPSFSPDPTVNNMME